MKIDKNNVNPFVPTEVQITEHHPTVLFIRNKGNIVIFDIGYKPLNIAPRLIDIFEDSITLNDPNYKMSIRKTYLIIISSKF